MRTKHVHLIFSSGKWNLLHPHEALLLAFNDGELTSCYVRRITSHLETCHNCRSLATQLRKEFSRFRELEEAASPTASLPVAEGLVSLLKSIPDWRNISLASPESSLHPRTMKLEVEARVISELEFYLGTHTVSGLVERLGRGQERFITEAEILIAEFLGRRVANEVQRRISHILSLESGFPHGPWVTGQSL